MAERLPTTPVRGMRDLLPEECALRDAATARILDVYRSYGFQRIETPALEHLELLVSGQGGENEKLIYKVMKRGDKLAEALQRAGSAGGAAAAATFAALAAAAAADAGAGRPPAGAEDDLADSGLRFDLTVPLARYFAEHQAVLPQPFKAIQIGPVWRAERPQKGRYRQFTQCDIDVLGDAGPLAEVELILATCEALAALGLGGFTVRVNDRRFLHAFAAHCDVTAPADQERLFIALDKLDKIGLDGVVAELEAQGLQGRLLRRHLEILQAASASDDPLARFEAMEWAAGSLAALRDIVAAVARGLEAPATGAARASGAAGASGGAGAPARVAVDFTLVRGMGYYTGPIFEISAEGSPGSLAGGGRYDTMVGRMLGREVPACGFSIGFERLMLVLAERGWSPQGRSRRIALLHDAEQGDLGRAMAEASRLRDGGAVVSVFAQRRKAGKQRADLEAQGFDEIRAAGGAEARP